VLITTGATGDGLLLSALHPTLTTNTITTNNSPKAFPISPPLIITKLALGLPTSGPATQQADCIINSSAVNAQKRLVIVIRTLRALPLNTFPVFIIGNPVHFLPEWLVTSLSQGRGHLEVNEANRHLNSHP
jgi:hypothetical protein